MTPPADVRAMAAARWCVLRPVDGNGDSVAIDYPGGTTIVWSKTTRDREGFPRGWIEPKSQMWERVRERLACLPERAIGRRLPESP